MLLLKCCLVGTSDNVHLQLLASARALGCEQLSSVSFFILSFLPSAELGFCWL
jgi:hypothetical protein